MEYRRLRYLNNGIDMFMSKQGVFTRKTRKYNRYSKFKSRSFDKFYNVFLINILEITRIKHDK